LTEPTESLRTVLTALGANVLVAIAKTVASVLSGSASMTAEAAHSWADTGNQLLLFVADRRSRRPADDRHPLGHGREAYVWAMLAAVGLFTVGASVSVWHGISELMHDESRNGDFRLAYIVLLIALVLECISLTQATRQLRGEAQRYNRDLLEHAFETSDPTTRAVFAEDSAAVAGIVIAFGGIGLHQLTGNPMWDAIGSILVGVLLGVVAVILIDRNRRFLTGEPGSGELRDAVVARIKSLPDVAEVRFTRLVYVGPKQLFLVASVDLVGDQAESHVAHTLRRLERELESDPRIVDAVLTVADPDDQDR
jgi:cation diffusion facilitator family transporter